MAYHRPASILLTVLALGAADAGAQAPTKAPANGPAKDSAKATPQGSPQKVDSSAIITALPGFRIQVRYAYDNRDDNNDFFIARTRLKAKGRLYGMADYGGEVKLDNVGRFGRGSAPPAQVENAWLGFPVRPSLGVRVGLYDAPFSRNALTSDSKLLLMDRSLIKDELTTRGLADNTVGLLVHGRPNGGRAEYAAGVFDNLSFDETPSATSRQAKGAMVTGRVGWHFLDPAPRGGYGDYQSSYLGQGRRLSIALNGAYLPGARQGDEFDIKAWGADAFFNLRALTFEAEYDRYVEQKSSNPDVDGSGWYVQGGYLVRRNFELAARHQALDTDDITGQLVNGLRWTSVGFNVYVRGHGLKIQSEYTFKRERFNALDNDGLQVQLQMDF